MSVKCRYFTKQKRLNISVYAVSLLYVVLPSGKTIYIIIKFYLYKNPYRTLHLLNLHAFMYSYKIACAIIKIY